MPLLTSVQLLREKKVEISIPRVGMDGPANIGSAKGRNKDPTSHDGHIGNHRFQNDGLLEHSPFLNVMPPCFPTKFK